MEFNFGFYNNKLQVSSYYDSNEDDVLNNFYVCWYEFERKHDGLMAEFEKSILGLTKDSIVFTGKTAFDQLFEQVAQRMRPDLKFLHIQYDEADVERFTEWCTLSSYRYFLSDTKMAYLIMNAEKYLNQGRPVAFIGPFPSVKDNFWMISKKFPYYGMLSNQTNYTVLNYCKNASPYLLKKEYAHFNPNVVMSHNLFLPYLEKIDIEKNAELYRALGIREFFSTHYLTRMIDPSFHSYEEFEPMELPPIELKYRRRKWGSYKTPRQHFMSNGDFEFNWEALVD